MAAPFKVGKKELYLPNIKIALLRTTSLGPNQAKFWVPLWFSKLDLRDYLYHVYNVRTTSIRSYVKQSRVQMAEVHGRTMPNRWHRPPAEKFMTVELERPFVWPERPEDFGEWNKEQMEASDEENKKMGETMGPRKDLVVNEERRKSMKEQARELLEGRVKWKSSSSSSTNLAR